MDRIREFGLKLSPKKCSFFQRKVKFLGYIVSSDGIEADSEKVEKIVNWPRPSNSEDVPSFLGILLVL